MIFFFFNELMSKINKIAMLTFARMVFEHQKWQMRLIVSET